MLDVIKNSLKCNEYYICLYSNCLYIYNYVSIELFNVNLIKIKLTDKMVIIKGSKLVIKKFIDHEILVQGDISGINYE